MARTLFIILCLATCLSTAAQAQEIGRVEDIVASGTAYHVFSRPGEATVQVLVVGTTSSGIYEVGVGTDLGTLLALTGGFALAPRSRRQRRSVTIRLLRMQGGSRIPVYEASIEDFLQQPGDYPALQDDDAVVVETITRTRFNWRDGLTILTAVATVSYAVDRLVHVLR